MSNQGAGSTGRPRQQTGVVTKQLPVGADVMVYVNYAFGIGCFVMCAVTGLWGWAAIGLVLIILSMTALRLKKVSWTKTGVSVESHPARDARR